MLQEKSQLQQIDRNYQIEQAYVNHRLIAMRRFAAQSQVSRTEVTYYIKVSIDNSGYMCTT